MSTAAGEAEKVGWTAVETAAGARGGVCRRGGGGPEGKGEEQGKDGRSCEMMMAFPTASHAGTCRLWCAPSSGCETSSAT